MERYLRIEGYFYNVGLDELLDILEDRGLQYFGLSDEDEKGLHVEGYLFADEEEFVSLLDDVEYFGYYREEEE
jgi:hypothetical protein